MHDVAHPQLAGMGEGEAAPVLVVTGVLGGSVHQAGSAEQAMHGRGGQRHAVGHRAHRADELGDRQMGLLLLQAQQRIGQRLGQRAGLASVGSALGGQSVEAAAPVSLEPVAQRLGGHPHTAAAGDGVVGCSLLAQAGIQPGAAQGLVDEIGDQAIAEQGDRLGLRGIGGSGHGSDSRWMGECPR